MERKLYITSLIALGLAAAPYRAVRTSRFCAVRHQQAHYGSGSRYGLVVGQSPLPS